MKRFLLSVLTTLLVCVAIFGKNSEANIRKQQQKEMQEYLRIRTIFVDDLIENPLTNTIALNRGDSIIELATPPVGNQGIQGACNAWAMGYGCGSIHAYNVYQDWNWAMRSPAFLFNLNDSNCINNYSEIHKIGLAIRDYGICSYYLMPYDENDCFTTPDSIQLADAALNKMEYTRLNSEIDINEYKQVLRVGYPIAIGTRYLRDLQRVWAVDSLNGYWRDIQDTSTIEGHAMCVVGYNDSIGAFKLMNSWDSIKGDHGFVWVSYNLVQNGIFSRAYVFEQGTTGFVPLIEGPDYLCDTTYYSVRNVPEGAACTWTVTKPSGNHAQYSISGQGTPTICVTRDTPEHPIIMDTGDAVSSFDIDIPYSPITGSVQVTVSAGGAAYSANKTIRDPRGATPEVSISDTSYIWLLRTNRTFSITNCTQEPDSVFEWTVKRNSQIIPYAGSIGKTFTYRPTATGDYTITVTNRQKECGKESTSMDFYVSRAYIPPFNNASYTLELWSPVYGRMRVKNVQNADEQIDTTGLPQGIYILLLKDKNGEIVEQTKIMKNN